MAQQRIWNDRCYTSEDVRHNLRGYEAIITPAKNGEVRLILIVGGLLFFTKRYINSRQALREGEGVLMARLHRQQNLLYGAAS
jgi:hypothetical protein